MSNIQIRFRLWQQLFSYFESQTVQILLASEFVPSYRQGQKCIQLQNSCCGKIFLHLDSLLQMCPRSVLSLELDCFLCRKIILVSRRFLNLGFNSIKVLVTIEMHSSVLFLQRSVQCSTVKICSDQSEFSSIFRLEPRLKISSLLSLLL